MQRWAKHFPMRSAYWLSVVPALLGWQHPLAQAVCERAKEELTEVMQRTDPVQELTAGFQDADQGVMPERRIIRLKSPWRVR